MLSVTCGCRGALGVLGVLELPPALRAARQCPGGPTSRTPVPGGLAGAQLAAMSCSWGEGSSWSFVLCHPHRHLTSQVGAHTHPLAVHTRVFTPPCTHTRVHTHVLRAQPHTHIHTHVHALTHTRSHTYTPSLTHTCLHVFTLICSHINPHIHTCSHYHMHSPTCSHSVITHLHTLSH